MKTFTGTLFKSCIPYGIILGVFIGVFNAVYTGFLVEIFTYLLIGLFAGVFVHIRNKKLVKNKSEMANGKNIIMDGAAIHFRGIVAKGGWLVLTSDEILFGSYSNHQIVIPLKQVSQQVKAKLNMGFVPNGIEIVTTDGKKEKFIVNNRKTWIQKTNELIVKLK